MSEELCITGRNCEPKLGLKKKKVPQTQAQMYYTLL